jgi:hypothetical protein
MIAGEVKAEQLERILDTARWTPAPADQQAWMLAPLSGALAREALGKLLERYETFEDTFAGKGISDLAQCFQFASCAILVLGTHSLPFWRESCILVVHQLMIAAAAEDLAARALTPSSPNAMARLIRIPREYLVSTVLLLGLAGSRKRKRPTQSLAVPILPLRGDEEPSMEVRETKDGGSPRPG